MCNQGSSCCWWIIIAIIILFLLCGNCGACKAPPLKLFLDNGLFCTIIRNACCATLVI